MSFDEFAQRHPEIDKRKLALLVVGSPHHGLRTDQIPYHEFHSCKTVRRYRTGYAFKATFQLQAMNYLVDTQNA